MQAMYGHLSPLKYHFACNYVLLLRYSHAVCLQAYARDSLLNDNFEKLDRVPAMVMTRNYINTIKKQHKQVRMMISLSPQALFLCKAHDTAGPGWFDLPATRATPEIVQHMKVLKVCMDFLDHFVAILTSNVELHFKQHRSDLMLTSQMRGVLDPKHHFKSNDSDALPKYFQVRITHKCMHSIASSG